MARRRVAGMNSAGTSLPTERTQFSRHAVPQVASSRQGLEQMGSVFSNFFGQLQGSVNNLQQEIEIGQRQQIEQENRAEKIQAQNDFFAGRGADPSLTNDLDYMDTFRGLQAQRVASDAVLDFQAWYQEDYLPNNRFGNLNAARDQWAQQNLGGLDDPEVSAQVMARFYQGTETMLGTHQENGIRMRREEDLINLNMGIYDDVRQGNMTVERVQWYINAAQQVDPLNANEAAPRVVAGLMDSVRNNPDQTQHVISLLTQKGTGINGRSFSESFPDAFADFQSGALTRYLETNTMEEYEFFRGIEDEIRSTPNLTLGDISTLTTKILAGRALYGAGRQADGLRDMLASRLDEMAKKQSEVGQVAAMLDGAMPLDVSHMRKHFVDYLEAQHGTRNVLNVDPGVLANDIARMGGVVPEDVKYQITSALTNSADPVAQEKALGLLSGIQSARGKDYAEGYLTDEGSRWYNHVQSHLSTDMPLADALRRTNESRANTRLPENFDWRTVTGEKTMGDAQAKVDKEIDKTVQSHFETNGFFTGLLRANVVIPENVMGAIRDYALTVYGERGADGIDMAGAVNEAVTRYLGQADVVGTEDNPVLVLNPQGEQVTQGEGGIEERVRLGTNVMSPSGVPVNTFEIYNEDLSSLRDSAPWMFPDGPDEDVIIDIQESVPGAFQIRQGGARIVFEAGETIFTEDGQEVIIPDNPEAAQAELGGLMPEGFGLVAERDIDDNIIGWQLMYRPHFGDQAKDLTDKEREFSGGAARTPEVMLFDLGQAMVAAQRESGILPQTSGVNQPLPEFRTGEDILNFLENELNRGVQQVGRRFIDRHAVNFDDTYRARRLGLLTKAEATRTHVYDDRTGGRLSPGQSAEGYRTVGIGFNMERSGARQTWNQVFPQGPSFDAVYSGEASISKAQAQRLFEHDMVYFEGVVSDAAGGRTLPENQHLALLSIAYNSPKRVADMSNHIATQNHAGVIHAMLYKSFKSNHPQRQALAARRYQETRMYAGSNPTLLSMIPPVQEYLNYWR